MFSSVIETAINDSLYNADRKQLNIKSNKAVEKII